MATYRELIYSVLDRIKAMSDDSIITEDHVIFTIDKVRAALLYQKYGVLARVFFMFFHVPHGTKKDARHLSLTPDLQRIKCACAFSRIGVHVISQ